MIVRSPMPLMAEYTITETLQEAEGSGLYRATRNRDRHPVLLKTPLWRDHPQPRELARFRHECKVAEALDLPTVLRVEDCDASSDRPVMVLEDFGGAALDSCLRSPLPVGDFLPWAIRMARALANIHGQGITHRDLSPRSFIVRRETTEVK